MNTRYQIGATCKHRGPIFEYSINLWVFPPSSPRFARSCLSKVDTQKELCFRCSYWHQFWGCVIVIPSHSRSVTSIEWFASQKIQKRFYKLLTSLIDIPTGCVWRRRQKRYYKLLLTSLMEIPAGCVWRRRVASSQIAWNRKDCNGSTSKWNGFDPPDCRSKTPEKYSSTPKTPIKDGLPPKYEHSRVSFRNGSIDVHSLKNRSE